MDRRYYDDHSREEREEGFIAPEEYRRLRYYKERGYGKYPDRSGSENPVNGGYVHREYKQAQDSMDEESYLGEESRQINRVRSHPVLLFQLIVCMLAALALFGIKAVGGDFYDMVKEYYNSYVNTSDIITDFFSENRLDIGGEKTNVQTDTEKEEEITETQSISGGENE